MQNSNTKVTSLDLQQLCPQGSSLSSSALRKAALFGAEIIIEDSSTSLSHNIVVSRIVDSF